MLSGNDIVIGAAGLGFDFVWGTTNRKVLPIPGNCCDASLKFKAVLPMRQNTELLPATRYTLRCNNANIIKLFSLATTGRFLQS